MGVVTAVSCGGEVALRDAGADAAEDGLGTEASVDAGGDAADLDAWWRQFDVAPFDGYSPPIPGEFPPEGGIPCNAGGECPIGFAACNFGTGWCCEQFYHNEQCVCGATLGCLPPQVCCPVSGQVQYSCVATANACPAYVDP